MKKQRSESMAEQRFDKRGFLRLAGSSAFALCFGQSAFAQDDNVLGLKLPKEVLDIIPRKPLSYVQMAESVIRLEREADRKKIPDSILSRNKGKPITGLDDALYQLVLPRLVALIDRAEMIDPALAEKAGGLLAELHQTQHELPEALRLAPAGLETLSLQDSGIGFVPPANRGMLPMIDVQSAADAQPLPLPLPTSDPAPEVQETAEPPVPDAEAPVAAPETKLPEPKALEPEPEPDKPLSRAKDFSGLKDEYGRLYRKLAVRPERNDAVEWHLALIRKSRARYENVGRQTGVPWYFIAVTHGLESSFNFRAHLHNGDFPLTARTRQVPAGRPTQWLPPSDWESSAKDALRLLGYIGQKDWSLERTLYRLEAYNGFGYRGQGVPTPYLWSFSNNYERGKYVADGKFSHSAKSQQCGAAVMLKMLDQAGDLSWPDAA
jgi:lysozyme family protein